MHDSPPDALDRRRFLRVVALAGLGVSAAGGHVLAQSGAPAAAPPATTTPAAPAPNAPEPISEDARALAGVLRRRYAAHPLDDAQWESVMRDVDGDLSLGKALRGAKLENADEPDVTFEA